MAVQTLGNNDFRGYLNYLSSTGDALAYNALQFTGNDGGLDTGYLREYTAGPSGNYADDQAAYDAYYNKYNQYVQDRFGEWNNRYNDAQTLGLSSDTGRTGTSEPDYNPEDLAYLDSLESRYKGDYGKIDNALAQSLLSLTDSYNKSKGDANFQRGRELENLDLQTTDTTRAKDRAITGITDSSRALANSLRRRIGMASGADSSAYQITAPGAVAMQESSQRGDVLENFGQNFRNLDLTKKRATQDYDKLLQSIEEARTNNERQARTTAEQQKLGIDETLSEIASQRSRLLGGGYNAARSAMAPYEAQMAQRDATMNDIFNKYRSVGKFNPVKVNTPQLQDYVYGQTRVQNPVQSNTQDPLQSPYKPFTDDEENKDLYA